MRRSIGTTFGLLAVSVFCAAVEAQSSVVATYAGDGLTVRVTEWNEENGTVRGELLRDGRTFPFTGKHAEVGNAEVVQGTFKVGEQSFDFSTRQEADDEVVTFKTGTTTYKLRPAEATPPVEKKKDANPLSDGAAAPAVEKPAETVAGADDVVRLKRQSFPDVSMGGVPAYTVLTPADWVAEGRVEWRNIGEVPFPQQMFRISTPAGGRITYVPNMTFNYMNAPGLGQRQGEPPPQNFADWFVDVLPRFNAKVSNVRIIDGHRETKLEEFADAKDREIGARSNGMRREIWLLNFEYDEDGVRRHDETIINFAVYAPFNGLNGFHTQNWGLFFSPFYSAPAESWLKQRTALYNAGATMRPTLRWFTLSQQIIAENSRQRSANIWEQIKRRGEQIRQMPITKAEESAYNAGLNSDASQRDRINGINETADYKDADGSTVNLSIHGKYKWTDGQGNIVVTNKYEKPGAAFQEMQPASP